MPNPFRLLEFNSKAFPEKVAADDGMESITWIQLRAIVKRIAAKLSGHGIKRGDLVVTCLPPKLDWIFVNALFHEACITCSNYAYDPIDPNLQVSWIISDRKLAHFPEDRTVVVDQAWLEGLKHQAVAEEVKDYADENALCRLILTSGTMGHAKAAAFSVKSLNERMMRLRAGEGVLPSSAFSMMPLSTALGFFVAFNSLFAGEACYFAPNAESAVPLLQNKPISYLLGSPAQFSALINRIEKAGTFHHSVKTVLVGGYSLSPALFKKLKEIFGADVYCSYGATEVGRVCINPIRTLRQLNSAGLVVHDATVEVTDETGGPLPFGREGIIRIKTPYIIHGYHNDPENTAKFLKDGWFYPGDVGRMTKHGWLILSGRHDEIINSGGVKIDPTPLDRFLLDYAGIQDAAVVGLENATGIQEIAAAVVASGDFDMRALRTELQKTFGAQRAPTLYFKVEKIPRNQAGKVMRAVMKQQLASIMAKRSEGESV